MVDFLDHTVVWWFWIIGGLLLIILELATGSFITLGLGIAALIVGLIDLMMPMGLLIQLLLWIVLSVGFISLFFKWFKRQDTVSNTGQSTYTFDTLGIVKDAIHPHQRGKVTFDTPVLGSTQWLATSNEILEVGTRIRIVEVNGQLITVAKEN